MCLLQTSLFVHSSQTGVRGTCTCVHTLSEMAAQVPLLSYDALQAYFGLGLCSNLT